MNKHVRVAGLSVLVLAALSVWPALRGIAQEKATGEGAYMAAVLEFLIRVRGLMA